MGKRFEKLPWDSEKEAQEHSAVGKVPYRRERSDDPYHTYRWTRLSRSFRVAHPICAECERAGRIVPSTCVDHIVPWPVCDDFYDIHNLQALCDRCNAEKGNRDKARIARWRKAHPEGRGVGGQNLFGASAQDRTPESRSHEK